MIVKIEIPFLFSSKCYVSIWIKNTPLSTAIIQFYMKKFFVEDRNIFKQFVYVDATRV